MKWFTVWGLPILAEKIEIVTRNHLRVWHSVGQNWSVLPLIGQHWPPLINAILHDHLTWTFCCKTL